MKKLLTILIICTTTCNVSGVTIKKKSPTPTDNAQNINNPENLSNMEIIQILRNDIATIDADIAKCESQRRTWIAATVIGSIGTIGTGVVAISQASKLSNKKSELQNLTTQVNDATQAANKANEQLKAKEKENK